MAPGRAATDAAPSAAEPPGPILRPAATAIYAALWLAATVLGWSDLVFGDRTAWLRYPVDSAERMVSRDLEFAGSLEDASPLERGVWRLLQTDREEMLDYAIGLHRELVASLETDGRPALADAARARLALLLAESGELDEALEVAARRAHQPAFAAALRALYAGEPSASPSLEALAPQRYESWLRDRLARRIALAEGRAADARAAERALEERGARWRRRASWLLAANAALAAVGLLALWPALRGARLPASTAAPWAARPLVPWLLADGLGVWIRGDFWSRAYFVALGGLPPDLVPRAAVDLLYGWGALLSSLPLLWLTWRVLLRPHAGRSRDPLGLRPARGRRGPIARIGLAALGVDLLVTFALGWALWALGLQGHWAETFEETLVWGSRAETLLTCADYVLWAPLVEELAFRGVLYASLRRRLSVLPAAMLSAGVFSALHLYSLPGSIVTFASGVVWALAFERARSLWPGLLAHAVYNLLFVAGVVLLYR